MKKLTAMVVASFVIGVSVMAVSAQIATGGSYGLDQAVLGNGGGSSSGGTYALEGTSGQSTAGTTSTGGSYSSRGGFWAPNLIAPSAAGATVAGRVLGPSGNYERGVTVVLSGGLLVTPRVTRTNNFGNFMFDDVEVGQIYMVEVRSKKLGFPQPSFPFSLVDNVTDIVFQAGWEN